VRDAGPLGDKLQISLDDRQVVALAVCAFLLVSGVFSVGLLLGRKISSAHAPAPVERDLAALDAPARAPEPIRAQPKPAPQAVVPAPEKRADKAEPVLIAPPVRTTTVVPAPSARPVQVPAPVSAALPPPPRELGRFTVQIGASQERADAVRLEARARGAGLKPYVVEANLGAKGTWYRVRVGAFGDKEAANRFRLDVERELRVAAAVMPSR